MENLTTTPIAAPSLRAKIWQAAKWSVGIFMLLNAVLILGRVGYLLSADKTAKKVAAIHAIRLTLADVDGSKLPPAPDPALNDATVEGIDVNHNYVRDDIERFIFETYPDQKERAVWMQWARAESLVMLLAIDKETLKAIMEEGDRAHSCAISLYMSKDYLSTEENFNKKGSAMDEFVKNTQARKDAMERGYSHMTSSGQMEGQQCDVYPEVR